MARLAQGDIWWSNQPEPAGRRPVLILTRSSAANRLNAVIVAQLTTTVRGIPSEVQVGPEDGLPAVSAVSLDNLVTLPRSFLDRRITSLSAERMLEVFRAVHYVLDMPALR